jgi:hypothetical protein
MIFEFEFDFEKSKSAQIISHKLSTKTGCNVKKECKGCFMRDIARWKGQRRLSAA